MRIDDRASLAAKLTSYSSDLKSASSSELILHAYGKWGTDCVDHLWGDFSFVIWDANQQRVFAARDQVGVFPLYYALVGTCLVVCNTLDALRQLPIVSSELNDNAIGDYLLIGENKSPVNTFYKDIQRLPIAHRLIAEGSRVRIEQYWTLPIDEPLYYKHKSEYVDHFNDLITVAVKDRLPDGPVGVFMSGGLDSPAVAATAVRLGAPTSAFTSVYDRLIPDQERHYAGLVAKHLNIPIHYDVKDDEPFGWGPVDAPVHTPEPTNDPHGLRALRAYSRELTGKARVFFWGDGPDAALMHEWKPHVRYLVNKRRFGRLCLDIGLHTITHKRVPLLPTIPRMIRERVRMMNTDYTYGFNPPPWLNPDFQIRCGLNNRWDEIVADEFVPHPLRPEGSRSFTADYRMGAERSDWVCAEMAAVFLHPLFDLRLVRFLVSVPALPWCRDKHLVRVAMRGILPEAVVERPKAPLAGLPYLEQARSSPQPDFQPTPVLEKYIDLSKVPAWPGRDREELDMLLRVLGLHYWFRGL